MDQEGSEVILGKIIIKSTGVVLRYNQPVYQQEEVLYKIPQLKRLMMSIEAAMQEAELTRKAKRLFPTPHTIVSCKLERELLFCQ